MLSFFPCCQYYKDVILQQEALFQQCGSERIIFKCFSEFMPGEQGSLPCELSHYCAE